MSYELSWRLIFNYRDNDNFNADKVSDYGVIEGATVDIVLDMATEKVLKYDATPELRKAKGDEHSYEWYDFEFDGIVVKPEVAMSSDDLHSKIEESLKYRETIQNALDERKKN